jgi:FtsP/CotA-like multicopper oxidase with cupredoxin domain
MIRGFLAPLLALAVVALTPPSSPVGDRAGDADYPCPTAASAGVGLPGLELFSALGRALDTDAGPADPCPRPAAGSVVAPPADLFSRDGALDVAFDYFTATDAAGRTLYCFRTPDGKEAPTLHLRPGDVLNLTLRDRVPPQPGDSTWPTIAPASAICGAARATPSSVNMHFHGTNTSPACHADGVIHTIVNSGQTFSYHLKFPKDEPPGLYWYHPHIYGLAEKAVQGGASGAIVVEGIENVQPAVAGLPERILIVRDQNVPGNPTPGGPVPSWDVSLNYVPIPYPQFTPAVIQMQPGATEFWRLANASADTVLDVQLQYDGAAQPLQIVALDGVPVGSQDGSRRGKLVTQTDILIPPAGRAEFIVEGPSAAVQNATLLTLAIDTGPDGDNDPQRPLATIQAGPAITGASVMPFPSAAPGRQRFEGLQEAAVTAHRMLYFSEENAAQHFFITVDGAKPRLFDPNNPPAITTTQGAVEDWTIENRAKEVHEFHIHQIHFQLLKQNGTAVPAAERQFLDTINIPYWSGSGPYPSVTVRMDFRGLDVGDFVYHCHILNHEDQGMMAIIRVLPRS